MGQAHERLHAGLVGACGLLLFVQGCVLPCSNGLPHTGRGGVSPVATGASPGTLERTGRPREALGRVLRLPRPGYQPVRHVCRSASRVPGVRLQSKDRHRRVAAARLGGEFGAGCLQPQHARVERQRPPDHARRGGPAVTFTPPSHPLPGTVFCSRLRCHLPPRDCVARYQAGAARARTGRPWRERSMDFDPTEYCGRCIEGAIRAGDMEAAVRLKAAQQPKIEAPRPVCALPGCSKPVHRRTWRGGSPPRYCSRSHYLEGKRLRLRQKRAELAGRTTDSHDRAGAGA